MSSGSAASQNKKSDNVVWHQGHTDRARRWRADRLGGATVWFTGLSGSGKSSVAAALERMLIDRGRACYLLDGDNLRHGLNGDLGFSRDDRVENVRRVGEVARLFADAGIVALATVISPYSAGRDRVRAAHDEAGLTFIEVFMDTPLAECERRDPKGLYSKARAGELKGFTGIDDPYEAPVDPELTLTPVDGDAANHAMAVLAYLESVAGD